MKYGFAVSARFLLRFTELLRSASRSELRPLTNSKEMKFMELCEFDEILEEADDLLDGTNATRHLKHLGEHVPYLADDAEHEELLAPELMLDGDAEDDGDHAAD